jgi:hypothetical protein
VEKLEFCHTIALDGRWEQHATTIPVEDLLLQKLQVHELTEADLLDAAIVLATHDVEAGGVDGELIDCRYVAGVLAGDWGFHRDATVNLERVSESLARLPLDGGRARRAGEGVARLRESIDSARKTMAWRMRARVGERLQWWEDVEEREATY